MKLASVRQYALASVGVAILVLLLKTAAYGATGSVALLSDALESIINVAVAVVAVLALRVSLQPADANHPFGHHKAEYFAAALEGALIVIASGVIFREAYLHIQSPAQLGAPGLGIAINLTASAVNAVWGWELLRFGRRERSPALIADARHVLTDVVSSLGIAAGVIAAVWTGWLFLDGAVAACAGVYILSTGYGLLKESAGGLMDRAVDKTELALIRSQIERAAHGAIEAHDLKTRKAGPVTFIEFHLVVPARMTVSDAHDICDRIEAGLRAIVPGADVSIHVEPETKAKSTGIAIE